METQGEGAFQRALRDTKADLAALPYLAATVVGVPATGILVAFLMAPEYTAKTQAIAGSIGASIWPGIVALFFLVLNLCRAPFRQRDEARDETGRIKAELDALKQAGIPRLAVSPRAGRRLWDWEHEHLMWAELEVANTSPTQALTDVEVRVTSFVNLMIQQRGKGAQEDEWLLIAVTPWNPTNVLWSRRNAEGECLRLTIPPGAARTALIAYSDDSNGPPAIFASPAGRKPHLPGIDGGKIELQITATNSAPVSATYFVHCHPNYFGGKQATMEIVPWAEWANGRTVRKA